MTFREGSRYADHPRITWFGRGGTVAYVDFTDPRSSFFIGSNGDSFLVIPPGAMDDDIHYGFASIDEGITWALAQAPEPT